MKTNTSICVLVSLSLTFAVVDHVSARGFRGGGGLRGGRSFSGRSYSPSFNRGASRSGSYSRPQFSRPRSTPSRSSTNRSSLARPSTPLRSSTQRPSLAGSAATGRTPSAATGRSAFQSSRSYQRPSQSQLNDFLNLPSNNTASGRSASATSSPQTQTFETKRGGKVTVGTGSVSGTTPGGVDYGAAGVGVKVETAGGNTFVRGAGVAGATNGTTTVVGAGGVAGARNAAGQSVARVGSVGAIRGPAGNVIATGRGAVYVNGQFVGGKTWTAVNGAYAHWGYFTPVYYHTYPGAWWPGKWAIAATAWTTATWAVAGGYCGCGGVGTYYNYGENVIYDDGVVYYEDQPVASEEEYFAQAGEIAAAGAETANEDWLPLGVFAVIADPNQTKTDKVLQLALNKEGAIRGNLHDRLTDEITPVVGSVDKETQRVALRFEGNDKLVVETGLYNLTNDEVPILVHFGSDRREERTLVRLQNPESKK